MAQKCRLLFSQPSTWINSDFLIKIENQFSNLTKATFYHGFMTGSQKAPPLSIARSMSSNSEPESSAESEDAVQLLIVKGSIGIHQDFPKTGIVFYDIFPVLRDSKAFPALVSLLQKSVQELAPSVDVIVGLESRGFLLGPILALHFKAPFVPIRKPGKLPGLTNQVTYQLEYGSDTFEAQVNSIRPNSSVVIVDDLLATGGSLASSCELVRSMGATVALCLVVIELVDLQGSKKVNAPLKSLLKY